MSKHAIIGFGCAGYHAAESIRSIDDNCIIDVYSNHSEAPYNPMLTTYRAGSRLPREAMFPFGSLDSISEKLDLNIYKDAKVKKILAETLEIMLENGDTRKYDSILISTGANAFAPPLPGLEGEGVYFMRTQSDADALFELLKQKKPKAAVVVGASMVGIKVAELLNNAGVKTALTDMAPYIFPLAAYPEVGELIGKKVEENGVSLAFGKGLSRLERQGGGMRVILTDGTIIEADIVALCIGTRANTSIVDPEYVKVGRAIRVNDRMETTAPGIYAAGDCCEGTDIQSGDSMIIGLWANAGYQGRTAGINMAGGDAHYRGNILHNITHFMNMDFIGLGDNRIRGEELFMGVPNGEGLYIKAYLKDGKLAGVNIFDNYRISGIVKNYFVRLLNGETEKINALQRGILIKEGLSPWFLDRLEGSKVDRT